MTRSIPRLRGQAILVACAALAALVVPLGSSAKAIHPANACLDLYHSGTEGSEVETDNPTGTLHTVTAQLRTDPALVGACNGAGLNPTAEVTINFEIDGANDPNNDGNGTGSPDYTCLIPTNTSLCNLTYTGTDVGTDTIRGWVGGDSSHQPDNAEPQAESPPTQDHQELMPDDTDVVTKTWVAGPAALLDCDDAAGTDRETETNPLTGSGTDEVYTCTVTDAFGNASSNETVHGENQNGINDPGEDETATYSDDDYSCTTSTSGSCSITVSPSESEPGTANICFWIGTEAVGGDSDHCGTEETNETENNDAADKVEKTWATRTAAGGGIDAEPETDRNPVNTNHTITVTVYDQFNAPLNGPTTVKLEFFQGSPSDSDGGNNPAVPDKDCTTTSSTSSCTIPYQSANVGFDRMCVWTNAAPTMTGNNTNGTCDSEGLADADDSANVADPPEPVNDDVDVIEKEWFLTAPTTATRLDCEPETDSNPTGTMHEITCTARDNSNVVVANANVDVEITGANDPDAGQSITTPDMPCNTNAQGVCTFKHGPGGTGTTNVPGTTTYRAWIDRDANDATTTDTDQTETQAQSDTDGTDVVEKTWTATATTLLMTPETDSATVGECNPYTVTVTTSTALPVPGITIDVEQVHSRATNATATDEPTVSFCTPTTGANPSTVDTTKGDLTESPNNLGTTGGETSKTTDANGQITFGIAVTAGQGSDGSGTVAIDAFIEQTDNDDPDTTDIKDSSTKTWTPAPAGGRTIDCEPETASTATNLQHTVTCTVRNSANQANSGVSVTFTETGPGDIVSATQTTTNNAGQATVTLGSSQAGVQTITGTITNSTQTEPDTDECEKPANDPSGSPAGICSDSVQNTWTLAPPEPECSDGTDNDTDGQIDFPNDPGCTDADDDDETDVPSKCPGLESTPGTHIVGTEGDDQLTGTDGDDVICGLGGDDVLFGGSGNDTLLGGSGNDTAKGGAGVDFAGGAAGKDKLFGGGGGDTVNGGGANDSLKGDAGNDQLKGGGGRDNCDGGRGRDRCLGGPGKDKIKRCETGDRNTRRKQLVR